MKNTFHVGRRWNIDAWSWSKNADGQSVAHGSRIMRFPKSFDIRSPGYSKSMKHVIEEDWYDVYPYSLVLWPHHFAENFRSGNWWIKRNNYSGLVMELVMEGNVVYECQRKKYVLGAGDLFLTYPGDNLTIRSGRGEHSRELQLCFSGTAVKLLVETLGISECHTIKFPDFRNSGGIASRMRAFIPLLKNKKPEDAPTNSLKGYELLLFLAESFSRMDDPCLPSLLTNAIRAMESCLHTPLSVKGLAAELGICRTTLNRLFRYYLNTTPHTYWKQIRMEHARQLVAAGQFSFKEIAARLGFSSSLYFSTSFRRYIGVSPSVYRKEQAKRNNTV